MANSNAAPPAFGGTPTSTGSTGFAGANDAPTTPAAPQAGAAGPTGPNSANVNPGVTTPNILPPSQSIPNGWDEIQSQRIIGGTASSHVIPITPSQTAATGYPLQDLLKAYSDIFSHGGKVTQEDIRQVARLGNDRLTRMAQSLNLFPTGEGGTSPAHGIGTLFGAVGQGLGQQSWPSVNKKQFQTAFAQAIAKTVPGLKASDILSKQPNEVLNLPVNADMAKELAARGFEVQVGTPISDAAAKVKKGAQGQQQAAQDQTAAAGQVQTYAQNYAAFVKAWNANQRLPDGASFQAQWMANLENAGLLNADINTATTSQQQQTATKGGVLSTTVAAGPSAQQVFHAYQQLLVASAQANQTPQAYLEAQQNTPTTNALANGSPSEMYAYVQGVATEFGVALTNQQINQIANFYGANASVADNPSSVEDQIKNAVVSLYDPTNPNNPAGIADKMYTGIQDAALQYQIPMNATQIGNMVKQSLQGASVESMYIAADNAQAAAVKQFQQQAEGLYPALAPQIAAGQTVQNLVAPYFNVAEAITGVPASTMMADQQGGGVSKWSAFLQGGNNPAGATKQAPGTTNTTGTPQMMTLDQWKTHLMQDPQYGFVNTQGGRDMAEQLTSAILNEFGKVTTTTSANPVGALYQGPSALGANTSGTG